MSGRKDGVRISTMMEVIIAAHFTHYVATPFPQRSGIFFVTPPQQLKSSLILKLKNFPDALVLSDLNFQQLADFKDDICAGRYQTLAFVEFNKIYQRNPATAAHLEGTLARLEAEG